ncbi:MAG: DPP IV N-terminal domain-containing protein, partial [Pseudomonadota bacterium]
MRGVEGFPIVDRLQTNESITQFRYWARAGQALPITSFFVFDVASQSRVDVDAGGDAEHLAFFLDWAPNSQEFAFVRYARDLSTQELFAVDAETGRSRLLLKERRAEGWVKWPGGAKTIEFLPSGEGFLWRSDRDGWFHLYRYDRNGRLIDQITEGDFSVFDIVAIDEENGWAYFMAGTDADRPYDIHLNRAPLTGDGPIQQLTAAPGQHSVRVSPDKRFFLDTHSHLDRPPQTDLLNAEGELIAVLETAVVDGAFRKGWTAPEEFISTAADDKTKVHGLIFKPPNFDPNRKHPVIERVYGAMQSIVSPRYYPGFLQTRPGSEYQTMISYLTNLGFIVVTMDTPGTPGRGREYNLATHGDWPEGVIRDHVSVLGKLASERPYMDLDRLGVEGNSWGGYMATRALTDAPEFYRAGAVSVPETDLFDHVHWIEFQLGSPDENDRAYLAGGTPSLAHKIEAPIL